MLTKTIEKDFQKLIREDAGGIFFHVIENADTGTLPNIFNKYNKAITSVSENSDLTLVLVCLKHRFVFYENFNTMDVKDNNNFFDMTSNGKKLISEKGFS